MSEPSAFPRIVWTCLSALILSGQPSLFAAVQRNHQAESVNPNSDIPADVLMIVVDDLNDWVSVLDPESPIQTPSLKRLAARGMLFTKAYCVSPACNPSRVATLTGIRPSNSGVYGNATDWRHALPERPTIMQRFRSAGYTVRGAGKVFHHHLNGAFHDEQSFDDFHHMRPQVYPPAKLNGAPEYGSRNTDWGQWPPHYEDSIDFQTVRYCVEQVEKARRDRPLFLACGIFKPHSPFFTPTLQPTVGLPKRLANDLADTPSGANALMEPKKWFWKGMTDLNRRQPGSYQRFVNAYAACAEFADAQIGVLLDALEASGRVSRTIIVLWSDHGFHLGEKDHIEKFSLWEKANRIPLIIVAPGLADAGETCDQPVDLSAIYPTLLELAGLPPDPVCDGISLVPLLKDRAANWSTPALMTYGKGNHAVRTHHWRYIRYADDSEELYDHRTDPNEWTNLALRPDLQPIIEQHKKWLPDKERNPAPNLRRAKSL